MIRTLTLAVLMGALACGGARKETRAESQPATQPAGGGGQGETINRDQCLQLIDHVYDVEVANATLTAAQRAEAAKERDGQKSDENLAECMVSVSRREFDCVMAAKDMPSIEK